jgi:predicted ribosomally synthesized peptide with SipW-like signal peptide
MKQILSSLIIVAIASMAAVGASFAYFSDVAASSSNTFSTGTMNLKLSDTNETDQDNVTASFGGTNLKPGDTLP